MAEPTEAAQEPQGAALIVQFNRDIRPILSDTCFACHGPDKARRPTALRFDTEDGAFADLGGYRAIVPGSLEESHLWRRITATATDQRMPPADSGRQLSAGQIDLIRRWIEEGAQWQKHWSLIPPIRPEVPPVQRAGWPKNPVDNFILARLEREGLSPSPEAAKETLIRRVTLDLTGLPPTLAEVDALRADESPDAYEMLVERLLASPRYGERMVLEWLEAARYADSNGYQTDGTRPMWRWRDGVIEALNRNQPFDQFTLEQLAGDLLPDATLAQRIASGFHRNLPLNGEGGRIAEESRVEYVVDRVETTATVWLGMTWGCGRCHDHKYDSLTQREFYQVYAYFNNVPESGGVDRGGSANPVVSLPTDEQTARIAELTKAVADLEPRLNSLTESLLASQAEWEQKVDLASFPAEIAALLQVPAAERTAEQVKQLSDHYLAGSPDRQALVQELDAARKALDETNRAVMVAMIMEELPQRRDTFILERGQYDKPGERVEPSVPAWLPPLSDGVPNDRLGFARWLVDPANPLTARVTVNRSWQMFFGTGIVKTSEDFGVQGEPPVHAELLDWLANEFKSNWDVKALHRLIVTSATYRQSSRATPELLERDPDNRLLARGPRFRWTSHVLRDQALALAGLLVEKQGGPPVKPYQPPGIWEDFSFNQIKYEQDHGESLYRRSLYTFWRRSVGPTTMFDTPGRQVCTIRQPRTNTPLQSLILLNDVTFVEAARKLAERMMKEGGAAPAERIGYAFRLATARRPSAAEAEVLARGYERVLGQYRADAEAAMKLVSTGESPRDESLDVPELAAYTGIASVILNLDEVLNKE